MAAPVSLPPPRPEPTGQPASEDVHTAAYDLDDAQEALSSAIAQAGIRDNMTAQTYALIGIGRALTALVRRQDEFYREVVAVLAAAKQGGQ